MSKKGVVLTGGGADGAFTVGRHFILNKDYDFAVTNSTGSLLSLLFLLKKHDRLKKAFFVEDNQILDDKIFNKKGKLKYVKLLFKQIHSLIFKTTNTFSTSKALRRHIDNTITVDDFLKLKDKEIIITCHSMTTNETVYISSKDLSFNDFKDWIWISANAPLAMSLVEKKRHNSDLIEQFCDGGLREPEPILQAVLKSGYSGEVDVYMHRPKPEKELNDRINTIKKNKKEVDRQQRSDVSFNDLERGIQAAQMLRTKLTIYWMPKEYYDNSYVFGIKKMEKLYDEGLKNAKKNIEILDFSLVN